MVLELGPWQGIQVRMTGSEAAHGNHVADVVPSGELDRLRETIEVLSDTELVRDLPEGLADARGGWLAIH